MAARLDRGFADARSRHSGKRPEDRAEPRARDADRHVLPRREAAEHLRRLKSAGDAGSREGIRRPPYRRTAVERDLSGRGSIEARQHVEERRLARAVRPDDGVDAATIHSQADIGESRYAAKREAHAARGEQRAAGCSGPLTLPSPPVGERVQNSPSLLWGEGRVRGGPWPPSRQSADHAFGQAVDRHEQEGAVEDEPVVEEAGQELRQYRERQTAGERPRDAPEPAEEQGQHEDYGSLEREAVGRNVAIQEGEERARRSRESCRDRERYDAHVVGGQAQRLRGDLAALDGEEGASPRRAAQVGRQPQRQRRRQHHGPVVATQRGLGDVEDAAGSARHRAPLDQDALDDQAEGDGDHGEIGSRDAERRGGDGGAHDGGDDDGESDGCPLAHPRSGDAESGRVCAEGVEAGVAERGLAGQAHEHVEPGGHDRQEPDRDGDVEVVGVGGQERHDGCRRREDGPAQPVPHTRLDGFSPSSPQGLATSTRITRPKPTISRARVEMYPAVKDSTRP